MQVFNRVEYLAVLLGITLATAIASPIVAIILCQSKRRVVYRRRNLQRSKHDSELRMVACVHNCRNVPSIITLLETSNPTKQSPIFLYVLQLIELVGRASSMLIVHNQQSSRNGRCSQQNIAAPHRGQQQTELINASFENYEQHSGGVSIQFLTAISLHATMHEDISTIAEDRHAALIVLPFHMAIGVSGELETVNPAIRTINLNVLTKAPCSVAIFVDRGLATGTNFLVEARNLSINVALLFIGGPDDRDALAYAWRMADHPGVNLIVLRFIAGDKITSSVAGTMTQKEFDELAEADQQLDEDFIADFRLQNAGNESVVYAEQVVSDSEETVAAIRSIKDCDLFVIGRAHGRSSICTVGLEEWSEYTELGVLGDFLISSDSGMNASVLVVQQYTGSGLGSEFSTTVPRSYGMQIIEFIQYASLKWWNNIFRPNSVENRRTFR
ncbi:hypothetical protein LUZ61_001515 [Rhynchospora tenuis]|uniref:Uncharacterized protein n=1 Tax=Rhynchospora tenuis TaxID=198213 RepID=A0AAD6ER16_9POAL|nr:hypothetical protein LUZ61_001515 [Rhynchospora tenuis]